MRHYAIIRRNTSTRTVSFGGADDHGCSWVSSASIGKSDLTSYRVVVAGQNHRDRNRDSRGRSRNPPASGAQFDFDPLRNAPFKRATFLDLHDDCGRLAGIRRSAASGNRLGAGRLPGISRRHPPRTAEADGDGRSRSWRRLFARPCRGASGLSRQLVSRRADVARTHANDDGRALDHPPFRLSFD